MTAVVYPIHINNLIAQLRDEPEFTKEIIVPMLEITNCDIETVRWTVGNWSEFVDLAHEVAGAILTRPSHAVAVAMPTKEFAESFIEPFFAVLCGIAENVGDCVLARNTKAISFRFGPEDIRSVQVFSRQTTPLPGVCANTMFVVLTNSAAKETPAAPGV